MSAVTRQLESVLSTLDPPSAEALERLARDAMNLVQRSQNSTAASIAGANGWPAGYFDLTAGSFENEPLDAPADPPPEHRGEW